MARIQEQRNNKDRPTGLALTGLALTGLALTPRTPASEEFFWSPETLNCCSRLATPVGYSVAQSNTGLLILKERKLTELLERAAECKRLLRMSPRTGLIMQGCDSSY